MKPRFQEPQDPCVRALLGRLDTHVARSQEWESAFQLSFGEEAFDEDYPCIDWNTPRSEWEGDSVKFAAVFSSVPSSVDEGPPEKCNASATHKNRLIFHFPRNLLSQRECAPRGSNPEPID